MYIHTCIEKLKNKIHVKAIRFSFKATAHLYSYLNYIFLMYVNKFSEFI